MRPTSPGVFRAPNPNAAVPADPPAPPDSPETPAQAAPSPAGFDWGDPVMLTYGLAFLFGGVFVLVLWWKGRGR